MIDLQDPGVLEDLEIVCLDCIRGDAYGPVLASRLERDVRAWLDRNDGGKVKVRCRSDRRGTVLQLLVPQPDATVKQLTLQVG